jgi:hypothetical protein
MCGYTGIAKMLCDWQTLIAGVLALVAAASTIIVTWCITQRQVAAANRQTEAVKAQNVQLKRQHEDEFRPICMLVPYDGIDSWYERKDLLTLCAEPSNPQSAQFQLKCVLRNIGRGPAVDVKIMLRLLDKAGRLTHSWELAPLDGGEGLSVWKP